MSARSSKAELNWALEDPVGSWAETVEEEGAKIAAKKKEEQAERERSVRYETRTVRVEEEDGIYEVTTTYKIIRKLVPRVVAERKKWPKFGDCMYDGPGPQTSTTFVAEPVLMQIMVKPDGTRILDAAKLRQQNGTDEKSPSVVKCRLCGGGHFSAHCPNKELFNSHEEQTDTAEKLRGGDEEEQDGAYVPPHKRDGYANIKDRAFDQQNKENTIRITNLPCDENYTDMERCLRDLFTTRTNKIHRCHVGYNRTTRLCKGYAYIEFKERHEAEDAAKLMNGHKLDYSIIHVEMANSVNDNDNSKKSHFDGSKLEDKGQLDMRKLGLRI